MKAIDLSMHDVLEECLEHLPANNTNICFGEIFTGNIEPSAVVVVAKGPKAEKLRSWMIENGYLEPDTLLLLSQP